MRPLIPQRRPVSELGGPLAHFFVSARGRFVLAQEEVIERLIGPSIASMGFRLVRVTFGGGSRPVLQIMAEPRDGTPMTIEGCTQISRSVSAILDVEDPIPLAYQLEVSSPGMDRPLVTRDDFRRFAGFEARLELLRPIDGQKRFRGRIGPVDPEDCVPLTEDGKTFALPFDDIAKAKLQITDDLIDAFQEGRVPPPAPDEA